MDDDDPFEAEYLARNNSLILKEMSVLKKQLFGNEEFRPNSRADATTRSLPALRSTHEKSGSGLQTLNTTQPVRHVDTSEQSCSTSQRDSSRSPRLSLQKMTLGELSESPEKMQQDSDRTPLASPTKRSATSPAHLPVEIANEADSQSTSCSSGQTDSETTLKIEDPARIGRSPQKHSELNSPRKLFPLFTPKPTQTQSLTTHAAGTSPIEVKNQQVTDNQNSTRNSITQKLDVMEALVKKRNEYAEQKNNTRTERVFEPIIHISPSQTADKKVEFTKSSTSNVARAQIQPQRFSNSERIPVQHRGVKQAPRRVVPPPEETRAVSSIRNIRSEFRTDQTNAIPSDTERLTQNTGSSGFERRRPVIPVIKSPVPSQHFDQSTWVEESAGSVFPAATTSNQMSPNDAVILPPADQFDRLLPITRPIIREYPDMFTDFRRQLAEEDRNKEIRERPRATPNATTGFSRDSGWTQRFQYDSQTIVNHQNFDDEPRSCSAMSKRAMLLPPRSKGREKSDSERRSVSVHAVPSVQVPSNQPYSTRYSVEMAMNEMAINSNQVAQKPTTISNSQQESEVVPFHIDLASLTSEALDGKSDEELQQIVDAFYESSPRLKFKESYPYMAEGMVQRDCQTNMLKVFSSRLGKTLICDDRSKKSDDYVYFLVLRPGEYRGFGYDTHPKCLISAKFPSVERIVVRGYAILAHPNGRADSLKESRWICWNDSLGFMSIISGAARIPLKKQPVWDKQLDIISIHANFENNRFVVTKVVALTNSGEKKQQFPCEVFLIRDPVYVKTMEDDMIFSSKTLNKDIHIKRTLVGEVEFHDGTPFELVVVPTFPKSTTLQFRALLLIHMPTTFWSRDKEWIREILVKKTETYRA